MMIKHIFQKEPVLSIATCLAIISAFFVPPGRRIPRIYRFPYSCNPVFANDSYGWIEGARRI